VTIFCRRKKGWILNAEGYGYRDIDNAGYAIAGGYNIGYRDTR
jgi:hypothetical protein